MRRPRRVFGHWQLVYADTGERFAHNPAMQTHLPMHADTVYYVSRDTG